MTEAASGRQCTWTNKGPEVLRRAELRGPLRHRLSEPRQSVGSLFPPEPDPCRVFWRARFLRLRIALGDVLTGPFTVLRAWGRVRHRSSWLGQSAAREQPKE
jgi:hypothetical protein